MVFDLLLLGLGFDFWVKKFVVISIEWEFGGLKGGFFFWIDIFCVVGFYEFRFLVKGGRFEGVWVFFRMKWIDGKEWGREC